MPLYELTTEALEIIPPTSFSGAKIQERADLQRLLRDRIEILIPDALVIAEEFGQWEDSRRRIDLLALDKEANLVVIELKRTEDGGHMELQAIRYAAMVSMMTFEQAVSAYGGFLERDGRQEDPREAILSFLDWEEPDEEQFGQEVRIVLASAEFSREITTAVLWLNRRGLDIKCIRLSPYSFNGRLLVDAQQIIPIPEAAEYQVRLQQKEERVRSVRKKHWDEPTFFRTLETDCGSKAVELARELYEWIPSQAGNVVFGAGESTGSFSAILFVDGVRYHLFHVRTDARVGLRFLNLKGKGVVQDQAVLTQLLERLNRIPGIQLAEGDLNGKPKFPLSSLENASSMQQFKETILWLSERLQPGKRHSGSD